MNNKSDHQHVSSSARPAKPKPRMRWWLKLIIIVLVLYFIPLPGYVWRLGEAVAEHGLSRQTWTVMARHTDWFVRYFTGPPSDEEMIKHFHQHRADLERAAHFYATRGHCHDLLPAPDRQECEQLQQRTGMQAWMGGGIVLNSMYHRPGYTCGSGCDVQTYDFLNTEPQDWWLSWNGDIKAWKKELLYVPPLLPANQFGLDPTSYLDDPMKVMGRECRFKASLDQVPAEIENIKSLALLTEKCAVRHIEGNWFIRLRPVVSL